MKSLWIILAFIAAVISYPVVEEAADPVVDEETGKPVKPVNPEVSSESSESKEGDKDESSSESHSHEHGKSSSHSHEHGKSSSSESAESVKEDVNAEIEARFGEFKKNCFPKPSGGCKCNIADENGAEVVESFDDENNCKIFDDEQKEDKEDLNEEIEEKFGDFKDNCFPRGSGGCSCNEVDAEGNEIVAKYDADAECKVTGRKMRRELTRKQIEANKAAVIKELKQKFAGLREHCYPRPKGCVCVTGMDVDGRQLSKKISKEREVECYCREGETENGCPSSRNG